MKWSKISFIGKGGPHSSLRQILSFIVQAQKPGENLLIWKLSRLSAMTKRNLHSSYLRVTLAKRQLLSIYSDKSVTITKHLKQVKLYNDQFFIVRKFHKRKQKCTSVVQPSKDLNMIASETGLGFFFRKKTSLLALQ